jgi:hypothetical protein
LVISKRTQKWARTVGKFQHDDYQQKECKKSMNFELLLLQLGSSVHHLVDIKSSQKHHVGLG